MASVIPSWTRVIASIRVRSPMAIRQGICDVLNHEPMLLPLIKASGGLLNVQEIVFLAFKQAIQNANADKKYFLQKLKEYNQMAEELSDYLEKLVEQSQKLSETEGEKDEPYDDCNSQPKSWLATLPVRYITVSQPNHRRRPIRR